MWNGGGGPCKTGNTEARKESLDISIERMRLSNYILKDTDKMQRRIRVRGKYCGATHEGLLSVMHKELLQIDKKRQITPK